MEYRRFNQNSMEKRNGSKTPERKKTSKKKERTSSSKEKTDSLKVSASQAQSIKKIQRNPPNPQSSEKEKNQSDHLGSNKTIKSSSSPKNSGFFSQSFQFLGSNQALLQPGPQPNFQTLSIDTKSFRIEPSFLSSLFQDSKKHNEYFELMDLLFNYASFALNGQVCSKPLSIHPFIFPD